MLHLRDGRPVGYAIYRTNVDYTAHSAQVDLVELIGIDPDAQKALWQYLFGIDLIDSIKYWNQPLDDPLRWWLQRPRCMERTIEDALWVRPVDVVAALNGRRYSSADAFVFRMRDDLCPWNDGVFRLQAGSDGMGECTPTDADPEIELTPFALGAVYLSGNRFSDLAQSRLLTGTPSALKRADAMFAWDRQPWCQEVF